MIPPAHLLPLALQAMTSFAAYEVLQDAMLESEWWDERLDAYRWGWHSVDGSRGAPARAIAAVLLFGEWSTTRWPLVAAHELREAFARECMREVQTLADMMRPYLYGRGRSTTSAVLTSILDPHWQAESKPKTTQRWWDGATTRRRGGR